MTATAVLKHSNRGLPSLVRSFAAGPAPPRQTSIPGVNHIVAVASGKGGVGKSTTAVNLAVALANNLGLRVGLLDADVYGPSVPRMLGISGKPQVNEDEQLVPPARWDVRAMSMGLLMKEEEAAVWRGPMVMSALDTFFHRVCWAAADEPPLDVLLLDMPPGTGDAQLQVSQRLRLDGAVIVTTPQDIALLDARRGCTMFRKVNVPILGIVENMSFFVCGNCGHEAHVFGQGGAARAAAETSTEVLGQIPLVTEIRETSDEGRPIVATQPDSVPAKAYVSVAERVWQQLRERDAARAAGGPRIVVE